MTGYCNNISVKPRFTACLRLKDVAFEEISVLRKTAAMLELCAARLALALMNPLHVLSHLN